MPFRHFKNVFFRRYTKNNLDLDKCEEVVLFNDSGESDNMENVNYLKTINQKLPKISFNRHDLFIDNLFIRLMNICLISSLIFLVILPIFPFLKKK